MTATHRRAAFGIFAALLLFAALFYTTIARIAGAKSTQIIHRAALKGSRTYPAVTGEAKWKAKNGQRELEVQIDNANPLKDKRLAVGVGGKLIGFVRVNDLGRARLVRRTEAGQAVPTSVVGKAMKVRTAGRLALLVAAARRAAASLAAARDIHAGLGDKPAMEETDKLPDDMASAKMRRPGLLARGR